MFKLDETRIAVVGLGYVGLPLAVAFASKFEVIAFDTNESRINEIKEGFDRTGEVSVDEMALAKGLHLTAREIELETANFYVITVPTPVNHDNTPDLSMLIEASKTVGKFLGEGDLVVFESTVYPGVTEEKCAPVIENYSGLKCQWEDNGVDGFFLGYSPERINSWR